MPTFSVVSRWRATSPKDTTRIDQNLIMSSYPASPLDNSRPQCALSTPRSSQRIATEKRNPPPCAKCVMSYEL
eukprot:1186003-Pleurochrysis_carterae.AAC.1